MSKTFRTTVIFDFDAPEGTDPDVFHDNLRDALESDDVATAIQINMPDTDGEINLETVRDINVEELDD
jgi:hypothetical protein